MFLHGIAYFSLQHVSCESCLLRSNPRSDSQPLICPICSQSGISVLGLFTPIDPCVEKLLKTPNLEETLEAIRFQQANYSSLVSALKQKISKQSLYLNDAKRVIETIKGDCQKLMDENKNLKMRLQGQGQNKSPPSTASTTPPSRLSIPIYQNTPPRQQFFKRSTTLSNVPVTVPQKAASPSVQARRKTPSPQLVRSPSLSSSHFQQQKAPPSRQQWQSGSGFVKQNQVRPATTGGVQSRKFH